MHVFANKVWPIYKQYKMSLIFFKDFKPFHDTIDVLSSFIFVPSIYTRFNNLRLVFLIVLFITVFN